jgi:hypothetical protein
MRTTYKAFMLWSGPARTSLYSAMGVCVILHIHLKVGTVIYGLDGSLESRSCPPVSKRHSLGELLQNLPSSMPVGAKVDPSLKTMFSNKKA